MIVNEANLADINKNNEQLSILTITLSLLAIFLNHSYIMFGINTSFADFFCLMALLLIINKIVIPIKYLLFFLLLSLSVLFTSTFFVPMLFSFDPGMNQVISSYLKLVAVFLYFILGFNIAKLGFIDKILKWYSVFGLLCAIIGIIWSILKINFLSEILFFDGTRYRGFMNDPNYFSIIQITSLAYLSRTVKTKYKFIIWTVFMLSVVVTGSKTGMITLIVYSCIRFIEYLVKMKKNIFMVSLIIIMLFIIFPLIISNIHIIFHKLSIAFPSFSRIESIFIDFSSAISENGSSRDHSWKNAIYLILISPILGIGVGTYSGLAESFFGDPTIAHNTYLQLAVEWGVPLSFIFFIYTFSILGISYIKYRGNKICILSDIIIILLIGSLAISLNNARMFWLYFGALVYSIYFKKKNCVEHHNL